MQLSIDIRDEFIYNMIGYAEELNNTTTSELPVLLLLIFAAIFVLIPVRICLTILRVRSCSYSSECAGI